MAGPALDIAWAGARLVRALGLEAPRWAALDPGRDQERRTLAAATACYADPPVRNALGLPLRPIPSVPRSAHYDAVLFFRGEVAFRTDSYHDWFNLLSWRVWPLSKAALNLRHTLHYLLQLQRLDPTGCWQRIGQRVPRDDWMQILANLDEGGCVAAESLLRSHTRLDDHHIRHWTAPPPPDLLLQGFRWFGHAVLEIIHGQRPGQAEEQGRALRMWVTVLDQPGDEALARRILTLSPELEPAFVPLVARLPGLLPFFRDALRFAAGDPFLRPFQSIFSPWG